jgi:hypothetical protein
VLASLDDIGVSKPRPSKRILVVSIEELLFAAAFTLKRTALNAVIGLPLLVVRRERTRPTPQQAC